MPTARPTPDFSRSLAVAPPVPGSPSRTDRRVGPPLPRQRHSIAPRATRAANVLLVERDPLLAEVYAVRFRRAGLLVTGAVDVSAIPGDCAAVVLDAVDDDAWNVVCELRREAGPAGVLPLLVLATAPPPTAWHRRLADAVLPRSPCRGALEAAVLTLLGGRYAS